MDSIDKQRSKELNSFNVVHTLPEEEFDKLTRLAGRLCDCPVALINFVTEDSQATKSCYGGDMASNVMPRSQSICNYTIQTKDILEIPDLTENENTEDFPYVSGDPHYRFYAGAPLVTDNNYAIGSLCVLDYETSSLTDEQREDLQTLADEVMARMKLRKREKRLEELNQFKDRLIKVVSHDIRNPLTGIIGAAEYLDSEDLDADEWSEMVEIIADSAGQINNLVSELLENEAVQFGDIKPQAYSCNVRSRIADIISMFHFSAKKKNITLDYQLENNIPEVLIDGQKYERMIANLVSNAIKFTPDGGAVQVSCRYEEDKSEDNQLITTVKDNGIGMPDEVEENLFELKAGGGRRGTNNENSYGLGMYIVAQYASACNADIEVESIEGNGTAITIQMPAPQAS